jgi:IMP dehydrogenase
MPVTIHRWFNTVDEQIHYYQACNFSDNNRDIFIAVGNTSKWKNWILKLLDYRNGGKNFGILVDVANGDTKACVETVRFLSQRIEDINIMAGNVATRSAFKRLQDAGANFIRVGIGGSSICATRLNTGFGVPTLTSIFDCAKVKDSAYLVADGGIEYNGDILKAMAAGADMVMCGKLFAATSMSGGMKHYDENAKEPNAVCYSGMASKEAINRLTSTKSVLSIEGISGLIPYTGETGDVVQGILGNLQTALSYYAGCRNWYEFKRNVKFLEVTPQGWQESETRITL